MPVEVLVGLAVRVAGEALEQADGLGEVLAVLLPCVGVAVGLPVAPREALGRGDPERVEVAEGEGE